MHLFLLIWTRFPWMSHLDFSPALADEILIQNLLLALAKIAHFSHAAQMIVLILASQIQPRSQQMGHLAFSCKHSLKTGNTCMHQPLLYI